MLNLVLIFSMRNKVACICSAEKWMCAFCYYILQCSLHFHNTECR